MGKSDFDCFCSCEHDMRFYLITRHNICLFAIRGWGMWSRAHEPKTCTTPQHGCAINTQIIGYLFFCGLWLGHQSGAFWNTFSCVPGHTTAQSVPQYCQKLPMGATNKGLSHSIRNRVCVRSYEFNVPILSPRYLARVQRVYSFFAPSSP